MEAGAEGASPLPSLGGTLLLSELIQQDSVLFDVEASDWRDAVRKAAHPLVARGSFLPAYVDDIIAAAEELGPYFVLTKGVALPHGLPETGVVESAMGLCRLARPVEFGSAACDPVRYLMVFGATNAEEHLGALTSLTNLLGDPSFFSALDAATEPGQVLAYVRGVEGERKE